MNEVCAKIAACELDQACGMDCPERYKGTTAEHLLRWFAVLEQERHAMRLAALWGEEAGYEAP